MGWDEMGPKGKSGIGTGEKFGLGLSSCFCFGERRGGKGLFHGNGISAAGENRYKSAG